MLDRMLNRFEAELKEAEAKVKKKGWGFVGAVQMMFWGLSEDEEAEVYYKVITDPRTYGQNKQLGKLLTDEFQILKSGQTVTVDLFNPLMRKLPRGNAKFTSPYTNTLMGTLCKWVTRGNKQSGNSARARFIAGLNQCCIKILAIENSDGRIQAWEKIVEILAAVSIHRLSGTTALIDSGREALQGEETESHSHFAPTLRAAKQLAQKNIHAEMAAKEQCTIQSELKQLNIDMGEFIQPIVTQAIYNLFIDTPASFELSFDSIHQNFLTQGLVHSFVTATLFQIMGDQFLLIPGGLLNFEEVETAKRTPLTQEIGKLNYSIQVLGGNKQFTAAGMEKTRCSRDSDFMVGLRESFNTGKLNIDAEGQICFTGCLEKKGTPMTYCFPSGFGGSILSKAGNSVKEISAQRKKKSISLQTSKQEAAAQRRKEREDAALRKEVLGDFIELLSCVQRIKNCLVKNDEYIHLLDQFGSNGTLLLFESTLYERIAMGSLLIDELMQKLTDISKRFDRLLSLRTGSKHIKNEAETRVKLQNLHDVDDTGVDLERVQVDIGTHSSNITAKCKHIIRVLKGAQVYQIVTQEFLRKDREHCLEQKALGMSTIQMLTPAQEKTYLQNAKEFDKAAARISQAAQLVSEESYHSCEEKQEEKEVKEARLQTERPQTPRESLSTLSPRRNDESNNTDNSVSRLDRERVLPSRDPSPSQRSSGTITPLLSSPRTLQKESGSDSDSGKDGVRSSPASSPSSNGKGFSRTTSPSAVVFAAMRDGGEVKRRLFTDSDPVPVPTLASPGSSGSKASPHQSGYIKPLIQSEFVRLVGVGIEENKKIRQHTIDRFHAIKIGLGYKVDLNNKLDPVILFEQYRLIKEEQIEGKTAEDRFHARINSKNNIIIALESKIPGAWQYLVPSWRYLVPWLEGNTRMSRNNNRAGRLLYCKEMVELFIWTINKDNEDLDEKKVDEMSDKIKNILIDQKQKQFWPDRFHSELDNLLQILAIQTAAARKDIQRLKEIQEAKDTVDDEKPRIKYEKLMGEMAECEKMPISSSSSLKRNAIHSLDQRVLKIIQDEIKEAKRPFDLEKVNSISEKIQALKSRLDRMKPIDADDAEQKKIFDENCKNYKSVVSSMMLEIFQTKCDEMMRKINKINEATVSELQAIPQNVYLLQTEIKGIETKMEQEDYRTLWNESWQPLLALHIKKQAERVRLQEHAMAQKQNESNINSLVGKISDALDALCVLSADKRFASMLIAWKPRNKLRKIDDAFGRFKSGEIEYSALIERLVPKIYYLKQSVKRQQWQQQFVCQNNQKEKTPHQVVGEIVEGIITELQLSEKIAQYQSDKIAQYQLEQKNVTEGSVGDTAMESSHSETHLRSSSDSVRKTPSLFGKASTSGKPVGGSYLSQFRRGH